MAAWLVDQLLIKWVPNWSMLADVDFRVLSHPSKSLSVQVTGSAGRCWYSKGSKALGDPMKPLHPSPAGLRGTAHLFAEFFGSGLNFAPVLS